MHVEEEKLYETKLDLEFMDNLSVHLTNNAIQKFTDNYGKYEDGN